MNNNNYIIKGETLSTIANGIRRIAGTDEKLTPSEMAEIMAAAEPGSGSGGGLETATIRSAFEAYVNGVFIEPGVDTKVPIYFSDMDNGYILTYRCPGVYNIQRTFTVESTGVSYVETRISSTSDLRPEGSINAGFGGRKELEFGPNDTIIITGVSDF
jgi:hypothetical protein